jgi:NifU-like protein involved in Fe-S cluster formation
MNEKNQFFIETLLNPKHIYFENYKYDLKIQHKSKICGDSIDFFFKIEDNYILEVKYNSNSCGINLVSAEIICEYLNNKKINIKELSKINFEEIIKNKIEIHSDKNHCLELSLEIINKIISHQHVQ